MESREQLLLAIKQEIDTMTNEQQFSPENEAVSVKTEPHNNMENPFQNIQLMVKQESSKHSNSEMITPNTEVLTENSEIITSISRMITSKTEASVAQNEGMNVKQEVQNYDSLVSFDSSNFDDSISMDSDDATALGNVEACLQEELNIKIEIEGCEEAQKEDMCNTDIKTEPEITLLETSITHINNIKSEHTSVPTGLIVVKKVVKHAIPEEIVPTCSNGASYTDDSGLQDDTYDDDDDDMEFDDMETKPDLKPYLAEASLNDEDNNLDEFQLNSITGNVLSLAQEAYLLEGKVARMEPKRRYKCTECPKTYSQKRGLCRHLEVHRSIEKRALGVLRGLETRKSSKKKKPVNERYYKFVEDTLPSQKKDGYNCTCGKIFQRRSRMETCLRSHELFESATNSVACVTCSKQFNSKDELALHRKRLHRKKFPCKFCPTAYDTRKELFKHLQDHQKVQLMEYKVITEVMKGKKKLCCFMCSKMYVELSDLKTHVMTNHKGPYTCPHCKNTFPKIIDFANHMKTYHPEVGCQSVFDVLKAFSKLARAWKCQECDLQFLEPDKLALHEVEAHSPECKSEPQFRCTDCRRVFISQKGLTSHRRVHHSEPVEETKEIPEGIMCLECRKICKDMKALTSHMRLHSPDRKYPCKFCEFRFATPEKRKSHAEIHTGDMKYVCFICEYQCSSENRLKKHKMSLKHANIKEYLLTGKPLIEESTSTSKDVKKYSKKKDKVVKKKKDKISHEKDQDCDSYSIVEKSEVPCDICGEKFPSDSEMLAHKESHPFIEIPSSGDNPTRIFFK